MRARAFAFAAILTLALGIGANSAIFSIVNAVLLRPLPYPDSDRLVSIGSEWVGFHHSDVSIPEYLDYKDQASAFESIAAYWTPDANFSTGTSEPQRIESAAVTASLFDVLKVKPYIGRTFTENENSIPAQRVVILGYGLFQRQFGGQSSILGSRIKIDDEFYTVIGVMAKGFAFPSKETQIWIPTYVNPQTNRGAHNRRVVARMKSGETEQKAQQQMNLIANRLQQQYPDQYPEGNRFGVSVIPLKDLIVGNVRSSLLFLFASICLVLLIACANVANLLMVRSAARRKEMAIRTALGASTARIVRQILLESMMLGLAGGLLGLLLASWCISALPSFAGEFIPRINEVRIDPGLFAFTFGLSIFASFLFGTVPAWHAARRDSNDALRESGRTTASVSSIRTKRILVVAEIALAMMLLNSGAIVLLSFQNLVAVNPGFRASGVMTSRVVLSRSKYGEPERNIAFYNELLERVRSHPEVQSAAVISKLPLSGDTTDIAIEVEGYIPPVPGMIAYEQERIISPDYFQCMKIPILQGRDFLNTDTADGPGAVIISDSLAKKYLPNGNPVGKRIRRGGVGSDSDWSTVVGVVGDIRHFGLEKEIQPMIYFPYTQVPERESRIVARISGNPRAMADLIQQQVHSIDKDLAVFQIQSTEQTVQESIAQPRFNLYLIATFSLLAVVLACIGIYGVISYTVSQRTQEFGIRIALGARSKDILSILLKEGLLLVCGRLLIGSLAAMPVGRLISSLLFQVNPNDPAAHTVVAVMLMVIALGACLAPGLRATRIDPARMLKSE